MPLWGVPVTQVLAYAMEACQFMELQQTRELHLYVRLLVLVVLFVVARLSKYLFIVLFSLICNIFKANHAKATQAKLKQLQTESQQRLVR